MMMTPARSALLGRAANLDRYAESLYVAANDHARRGFDPAAVRGHAAEVADEADRLRALAATKRDVGSVRALPVAA